MSTYENDRQNQGDYGGQQQSTHGGEFQFPYEDPAVINPDELATFPKTVNTSAYHTHESHLVSKRTPIRDGRNITITDNHPDKRGFI